MDVWALPSAIALRAPMFNLSHRRSQSGELQLQEK